MRSSVVRPRGPAGPRSRGRARPAARARAVTTTTRSTPRTPRPAIRPTTQPASPTDPRSSCPRSTSPSPPSWPRSTGRPWRPRATRSVANSISAARELNAPWPSSTARFRPAARVPRLRTRDRVRRRHPPRTSKNGLVVAGGPRSRPTASRVLETGPGRVNSNAFVTTSVSFADEHGVTTRSTSPASRAASRSPDLPSARTATPACSGSPMATGSTSLESIQEASARLAALRGRQRRPDPAVLHRRRRCVADAAGATRGHRGHRAAGEHRARRTGRDRRRVRRRPRRTDRRGQLAPSPPGRWLTQHDALSEGLAPAEIAADWLNEQGLGGSTAHHGRAGSTTYAVGPAPPGAVSRRALPRRARTHRTARAGTGENRGGRKLSRVGAATITRRVRAGRGRPRRAPRTWPPMTCAPRFDICFASRFPMLVWWGPELTMIYNAAYAHDPRRQAPRGVRAPGRRHLARDRDTSSRCSGQAHGAASRPGPRINCSLINRAGLRRGVPTSPSPTARSPSATATRSTGSSPR